WIAFARTTARPWAVKRRSLASGASRLASSRRSWRSQRWTIPAASRNAARWLSAETTHRERGSRLGAGRNGPGPLGTRPSALHQTGGGRGREGHGLASQTPKVARGFPVAASRYVRSSPLPSLPSPVG